MVCGLLICDLVWCEICSSFPRFFINIWLVSVKLPVHWATAGNCRASAGSA